MITLLKGANLTLAFLLELAMLGAFAYWGFGLPDNLLRWLLGLGVPVVVIFIWARYLAPNSKSRLRGVWLIATKLVLFGLATVALVSTGQGLLAALFALLAIINLVLSIVWKQE
ncbi:MAG: YrdB family protein [Anaerolineae bacterium]|nr:YrdB family protein [Anaerolineae bacterium]